MIGSFSASRLTAGAALVLTLLLAGVASAAQRVPATAWRNAKVYDMRELKKLEPLPFRRYVGVRFQYRHATIRHLKPNWHQGSIWRYSRGAKEDFDYIPVMVSTADLPAFRAFPSSMQTAGEFVVYGQILKEADSGFIFLRLVGTKVKKDRAGNVTVSW